MEKVLSVVAILVATLALLFGGYFSASWTKEVFKPTLSIGDVVVTSDVVVASEESLLDVSSEIRERSKRARFFPTLGSSIRRQEIQELLRMANVHALAVQHIQLAEQTLSSDSEGINAGEVWNNISDESRALLLTYRTTRIVAESLAGTDQSDLFDLSRVVDSLFEGVDPSDVDIRDLARPTPAIRTALAEALEETTMLMGSQPTVDELVEMIQTDADRLRYGAAEYESFRGDLERLLNVRLDAGGSTTWRVTTTIYNAGSTAESVFAMGAISIQRQPRWDGDNGVFTLDANDADMERFVVPSGEAVQIELSTTRPRDNLDNWFEAGDKDFLLSLPLYSGGYVMSRPHKFSRHDVVGVVRTGLEQHATTATP